MNTFNGVHIGLRILNDHDYGDLFFYFFPEMLIMFTILAHMYHEIMVGLFNGKETEIESIE